MQTLGIGRIVEIRGDTALCSLNINGDELNGEYPVAAFKDAKVGSVFKIRMGDLCVELETVPDDMDLWEQVCAETERLFE